MVLGDSNFVSSAERRAAFLTELGDVLYQEHDDISGAAKAYDKAQTLHSSDYIAARMVYLERRKIWSAGPDYGLDAIFQDKGTHAASALFPGLDVATRIRVKEKILNGDMGQYLLLNWHETSPRFFVGRDSLERDSTRAIFRTWLRLQPYNPAALDSLAAGFQAQSKWDSAEAYSRREITFYPMGNEWVAYRLAWAAFEQEHFDALRVWLKRCPSLRDDARYLLMQAALDWQDGHHRRAVEGLRKSLKLDKTLPESHHWMERMAVAKGDSSNVSLYHRWRERMMP